MKMNKNILDNDLFVRENLELLVRKYPHQRIVICQGEIFTGDDAVKKARKRYRSSMPMTLPIPGPEEFNHLL